MADQKQIDTSQVVRYLSHAFSKATQGKGKAIRAINPETNKVERTPLYMWQVEFCYMIDLIQRGPSYIVPKVIADANDLIERINAS